MLHIVGAGSIALRCHFPHLTMDDVADRVQITAVCDPVLERDKGKRQALLFEEAAMKVWTEQIAPNLKNPKHIAQWLKTLQVYAFPRIGSRPVHTVTQSDILSVLAPIWTEKPSVARRVRQRLRTVFSWARTAGHYEGMNPVEGVEGGLPKQRDKVRHFTALPYEELPDLMQRIETVEGLGTLALQFVILTAARSGEARGAMWSEIDVEARVWTVPPVRIKVDREHRVPLSEAAMAMRMGKAIGRCIVLGLLRRQGGTPQAVHGPVG